MHVQSRWLAGLVLGIIVSVSSLAQAQSWKPTLRDADELYDAAEDLHDRAEHFRDGHTLQITALLEQQTADLYQLLKRNACATEVVTTLNATGATLQEATMLVSLSCQLRGDRKAQSELANAQRYFEATVERVQCVLESSPPRRSTYHAPTWQAPAPTWYQAPAAPQPYYNSHAAPYGHEVHYHPPAPSAPRGLPRVLVQKIGQ